MCVVMPVILPDAKPPKLFTPNETASFYVVALHSFYPFHYYLIYGTVAGPRFPGGAMHRRYG